MSSPRKSVVALLLAALLLAAGCTGGPGPGASPTSATPTETPPGTVAGGTPATTTDGEATSTSPRETTAYGTAYTAPNDRVRITSRAETPVTVTVVRPEGETRFERTYGPNAGELDLARAFALEGPHRVVVAAGGEVRWNRTVYEYQTYDLLVAANGSVTVESVAEV